MEGKLYLTNFNTKGTSPCTENMMEEPTANYSSGASTLFSHLCTFAGNDSQHYSYINTPMRTSLFLVFFFMVFLTYGQPDQAIRHCEVSYPTSQDAFEQWLQKNISTFKLTDQVLRIPVVIHVLHEGEAIGAGSNVSDEHIQRQIDILNEDFRMKEGTRGHNEHPAGADAGIEFELAKVDPDGQPTTGIVRVDASLPIECELQGDALLRSLACYSYWNKHEYLNIWVFELTRDILALLGLATFPGGGLPDLEPVDSSFIDGVFVDTRVFGENTYKDQEYFGKTATHEIGHYLGLYHIWGQATNCEDATDYCYDTPNPGFVVQSCAPDTGCDDTPVMVENYMTWVSDDCMRIFTNDQITRMRTVLISSPDRSSLLTSPGLGTVTNVIPPMEVTVAPNPFSDMVTITGIHHIEHFQLVIHDLSGKRIPARLEPINDQEVQVYFSGKADLFILSLFSDHRQVKTIKVRRKKN